MSSRVQARLYTGALWLAQLCRCTPRRPPEPVRHVLVLHHLLLGDSLMAMSLIASLRHRYPEARIVLALPQAFVPLLAQRPWGVEVLGWDPRNQASVRMLRTCSPNPDLCFLPADNRYAWLARGLGARWIVGFASDQPAYKNWMLDSAIAYTPTPAAWSDTVAELADHPGTPPYQRCDWLSPPVEAPFTPPTEKPYVLLHVGASSTLKLWPADRWFALAERLEAVGLHPLWSAGIQEKALVHACDPQQRWPSTAGQLNLPQLWHLVEQAALLICPDTSIAHLGRITNTPTLCLFGPGSTVLCGAGQFWQHAPYRALSIDIDCRNQTTNFQRSIPWIRRCERFAGLEPGQCSSPRCMLGLTTDRVFQEAMTVLQDANTT